MTVETQILVDAGHVFHKDTQTRIGRIVDCGYHSKISFFLEYQTGDETDVEVTFWTQRTADSEPVQDQTWSTAAGDKTHTMNAYLLIDTVPHKISFDVSDVAFCFLAAGGRTGDGTPTGSIEAAYTLK